MILIRTGLQGSLHFVQRRPTSPERYSIAQSGHVFIYNETTSGIQRWADGQHWSPSRVLGDFLIYGARSASPNQSHVAERDNQSVPVEPGMENWHQRLYGPLAKSFDSTPESLVKKTINVRDSHDAGAKWHLVSYYRPIDVLQGRLKSPSMDQNLAPLWHIEGNSMSRGNLPQSYEAGDSSIWPIMCSWNTWESAILHCRPCHHTFNELGYNHCDVHQMSLSYPGCVHTDAIPRSTDYW